ncbi:MAG: beta-N-acetylglucosaminidase domain-containing protein [Myxococcota bacterium]
MSIGIIEGFYGEDWGWQARTSALPFLQAEGLDFYFYAPKGDAYLRKRWREAYPPGMRKDLRDFGAACRRHQIAFGVGLSPLRLHETWSSGAARSDLLRRVASLNALRLDQLAILFDDMPGSFPDLAQTQADIVHLVADQGVAETIMMCPTYYTDQAILDRLFGARPAGYLEDLGRRLDPAVEICWTGPKVVSTRYPDDHLDRVAGQLGRRPFIWDNYPVNDGPRMSRFLHLQAPDRPPGVISRVSRLAINPMNQSWLSRIPIAAAARTLQGLDASLDQDARTDASIDRLVPAALAALLKRDWRAFQFEGLDASNDAEKAEGIAEYSAIDHPAAAEVVRWLKGEYIVSADILTDA